MARRDDRWKVYEPLIRKLASPYKQRADYDDIVQCARLAAWRACDKYDPNHGTKELTYVYCRVWGAVRHYFRSPEANLIKCPRGCEPIAVYSLLEYPKRCR